MAYPPQYRPTPPPEALRRVSASMEVPGSGYNITDARTGQPPAPPSLPVQPAAGLGPAVPPRMSAQDHRIEEWRRLHHEAGPAAAAEFLRGNERDPSRLRRMIGRKYLGYKVPKEKKKIQEKCVVLTLYMFVKWRLVHAGVFSAAAAASPRCGQQAGSPDPAAAGNTRRREQAGVPSVGAVATDTRRWL